MAEGTCYPLINGRRFRFTALDGCGRRKSGGCVSIVSDGIISVSVSSRTEEGTPVQVQNSNGRYIVNIPGTPTFSGHGAEISLAEVNPDLIGMLTGNKVVYDARSGNAIGFKTSTKIDLSKTGFALEVWMDVPGVACDVEDEEAEGAWGYVLLPYLSGGVLADFEIANGAVNFSITGAATKDGGAWGFGPYDVVLDAAGLPSPLLDAMEPDEPMLVQLTNVAPPDAGCSCDDSGVVPATVTAGIPATYGPTDAYAPLNLAELEELAETPSTAWTVGQYAETADGEQYHWTGTAWAPGPKPA